MRSAWFAFAATFVMAAVSLATCIYAIRVNMKRWSGDEMRSLLEAEAKHLAERVPYGIPNTMGRRLSALGAQVSWTITDIE